MMAGMLANIGQPERAAPLLDSLRADVHGGPVGLFVDSVTRSDTNAAVRWAIKAADVRFPAFIPIWVRAFEPVLRESADWPAVLKAMNLAPRRD